MNYLPARDVDVFTEALEKPPGERAAYLEKACAGDGALRHRVDILLRAHERAGDFLGESASGLPAGDSPKVVAGEELYVDSIELEEALTTTEGVGCGN